MRELFIHKSRDGHDVMKLFDDIPENSLVRERIARAIDEGRDTQIEFVNHPSNSPNMLSLFAHRDEKSKEIDHWSAVLELNMMGATEAMLQADGKDPFFSHHAGLPVEYHHARLDEPNPQTDQALSRADAVVLRLDPRYFQEEEPEVQKEPDNRGAGKR